MNLEKKLITLLSGKIDQLLTGKAKHHRQVLGEVNVLNRQLKVLATYDRSQIVIVEMGNTVYIKYNNNIFPHHKNDAQAICNRLMRICERLKGDAIMYRSKQEFLEDMILTKHRMIQCGQIKSEVLAEYIKACDDVI